MRLHIDHVTTYRYSVPVELLPHHIMLRPRGSGTLHVASQDLRCCPASALEWAQDVFGNLVATASFSAPTDRLQVINRIVVEQSAVAWPVLSIAPHAHHYPFEYSAATRTDLGALLVPEYPDIAGKVAGWAHAQRLPGGDTDTLSLLQDLNHAVRHGRDYVTRDEVGTQSPEVTIALASGSCRDFATLFIDAARHLGFGARAVSGYLFDGTDPDGDVAQHGATHAWAEVYLPGAGWVAFDPTNGRMGEAHLVPVAFGRNIAQLSPVDGRYIGDAGAFLGMSVTVNVREANVPPVAKDDRWKCG